MNQETEVCDSCNHQMCEHDDGDCPINHSEEDWREER